MNPGVESTRSCGDAPDLTRTQYIIGYGSLMQDESRKRTSPQAGSAQPVEVSGYPWLGCCPARARFHFAQIHLTQG